MKGKKEGPRGILKLAFVELHPYDLGQVELEIPHPRDHSSTSPIESSTYPILSSLYILAHPSLKKKDEECVIASKFWPNYVKLLSD